MEITVYIQSSLADVSIDIVTARNGLKPMTSTLQVVRQVDSILVTFLRVIFTALVCLRAQA